MAHELLVLANGNSTTERERALLATVAKVYPAASIRICQFEFATLAIIHCGADGDVVMEKDEDHQFVLVLAASANGGKAVLEGFQLSHEFGTEAAHLRIALSKRQPALSITNDGLGLIRMYWAAPRSEVFVAATSLTLIQSSQPHQAINEVGAAEYLLSEQLYGSKTLFRGVSRLKPGSVLEWSPKGTTMSARPLLALRSDYAELREDIDDWAHAFMEIWHNVLADLAAHATGRIMVGLSAGLDSRTIAGGFSDIAQPFTAFTYGSVASAEVRVATSVSATLAAPHVLIPYGPHTILRSPDLYHSMLEDGISAVNAAECWFHDVLPLIGQTFVTGYGGDALWGNDQLWGVCGIGDVQQRLLQRLARQVTQVEPFVERDFAKRLVPLIRETVEETTDGLGSINRPDIGLMWLLQNRVVGFGWNVVNIVRRTGLQYENPFFSSRILKFILSMPPSLRAYGRAYLRVHREFFPRTAQFARNIDGAIPARDKNYLYLAPFARRFQQITDLAFSNPRYAARRLGAVALNRVAASLSRAGHPLLSDRLVRDRSPFAHEFAARELPFYRDRLAALIERARDADCPLLSRRGLTDALETLKNGSAPASPIILGRLAALAAWTTGRA